MITFYVGMTGLNIRIDEFMTEDEWQNMPAEDFPANVTWESATVANEQDMNEWIAAKNRWLCACWTPNQDYEDREENAVIMREASILMEALMVEASKRQPLTKNEVAACLNVAKENINNPSIVNGLQILLINSIKGMEEERPEFGPVASASAKISHLFVERCEEGSTPDLVEKIYALMQ